MKIKRIQSVNFFGKIKDKARDVGNKAQEMKTKWDDKVERSKNYFKDDMSKQEVQEFLTKQFSPTKIKLGKSKKVENKNGGIIKFLAGLPESKSYECGYIFRNGNDIRICPFGSTQFTIGSPDNPDNVKNVQAQALEWFDAEDPEEIKEYY